MFRVHRPLAAITALLALTHGSLVLRLWGWGQTWTQVLVTSLGFLALMCLLTAASLGIRLAEGELMRSDHRFYVQLAAILAGLHGVLGWWLSG